jgi:hypothetical protein
MLACLRYRFRVEEYGVSKKMPLSRRRSSRRSPGQKRPPSPAREAQLDDVVDIIFNPVYGYGRLLLPTDTVVAHVLLLNRALAERQKSLGRALTLEELDKEYTDLMDWLVAQDLCWHEQDVPALISKEEWLQAQQIAIQQLAEGKEVI